jgi:tRNA A22 N-methylase
LRLTRKHIVTLAWRRAEFGHVQRFVLQSRPILLTLRSWSTQLAFPIVLLDLWLTGRKLNRYSQSG